MQKITEERIILLKEWITGTETGDVCKGSLRFNVYPEENITKDRPLKKVLEKLGEETNEMKEKWDERVNNKESCNIMLPDEG